MKTVQLKLITIALCSLYHISSCSELQRTLSHDGTRKVMFDGSGGMFGSGVDTLEKLGQPYGKDRVYAIGSDEKAAERWAKVGEHEIKTIKHAHLYLDAIQAKGLTLPEQALKPAQDLIKAERQKQREASKATFENLNQEALQLIFQCAQRQRERDAQIREDIEILNTLRKKAEDHKTTHNQTFPKNPITTNSPLSSMKPTNEFNFKLVIESLEKQQTHK